MCRAFKACRGPASKPSVRRASTGPGRKALVTSCPQFGGSEAIAEISEVFKRTFYFLKVKIKLTTPLLETFPCLDIKSQHFLTALTSMTFLSSSFFSCFSLLVLLSSLLPHTLWPPLPSSVSFNPPAPGPLCLLPLPPSAGNSLLMLFHSLLTALICHSLCVITVSRSS